MSNEVAATVEQVIRNVAEQRNLRLPAFGENAEIVDELGFSSLAVAALIANLEEVFGVDPFQDEDVMITDIRTVGDLRRVYENCLARSH